MIITVTANYHPTKLRFFCGKGKIYLIKFLNPSTKLSRKPTGGQSIDDGKFFGCLDSNALSAAVRKASEDGFFGLHSWDIVSCTDDDRKLQG